MHILHVETGRRLYGGALQVLYLMRGLKSRGFRNTLVCPSDGELGRQAADVATVHTVAMSGELDPTLCIGLVRAVRRTAPDIVHVHSRRGADLWGGIAAHLTGTTSMITRRVDNPEAPWLARIKYAMYDRVITISEGVHRVLLSQGVPGTKLVCVPSAVDSACYELACDRRWFRGEFRLPHEARVIGVIAQMIPRKGHRYLIRAAPGILHRFPAARFVFFGQGPLEHALKEMCRKEKIGDSVYFAGFRTDLERILPCLDLVVHPATMEGLGVCLLQAAAAGVPVVAARAGGVPEVVRDGLNGYLVAVKDENALGHAVGLLLGDAALAKRMGQAGREIARRHFSIEAMVAGNIRAYQHLRPGRFT